MLPSLGQHNLQSPDARLTGSEAIQQMQVGVNKKDIDPANVWTRPLNEEVDAIPTACTSERLDQNIIGKKLGSAAKGSEINLYLVAEARTSISQVDFKR
jgi:hypothetical protein